MNCGAASSGLIVIVALVSAVPLANSLSMSVASCAGDVVPSHTIGAVPRPSMPNTVVVWSTS